MIDFQLLEKLINSAKNPSAGKPLDKVKRLTKGASYSWCNGMRSCRLFKVNDTNWRVELHGNTIARIVQLDDGCAQVTVRNVETWPTMTTAARLTSVLGLAVFKHENKLRVKPKNCTTAKWEKTPPMRDDQQFHLGPAGVVCMNPEIVTEPRTRILKEPSKPILAYLREIKKLASAYIKVGSPTYQDLSPYISKPLQLDIRKTPDMEDVMLMMADGACKRLGSWRVRSFADQGLPISADTAEAHFKLALTHAKDILYSQHGVYEKYTHSFADQFEEARRGSHTPLAQAA